MEVAITISYSDIELAAIHHSETTTDTTVVFVAGRPQTRVGPHRLFVELARALAKQGISSIRFDHQGWGESSGQRISYQESWQNLKAVHAYIKQQQPEGKVIFLGLCDGATASILSLNQLSPDGLILLNPYLESESAASQAMLQQHYLPKFKELSTLVHLFKQPHLLPIKFIGFLKHWLNGVQHSSLSETDQAIHNLTFTQLATLLVLSENDLTATQAKQQLSDWLTNLPSTAKVETLANADHTFSKQSNKQKLISIILNHLVSQTKDMPNTA